MTHIKNKRQRIIIYLSMALLFITGFSSMAYAWPALTSSRWKNMTVPQLQSLLKHRDVNARTESGWHPGATALIHAVRAGASLQILELLLESGADIEAETEQNYTALRCEQRNHETKPYHRKHKTQRWNENCQALGITLKCFVRLLLFYSCYY